MKFLLYFVLFFISISTLSAQWDNDIVCPGDSSHCEWRDTVRNQLVHLSARHDQYADVLYRYRYCNGVLEIDVLSVTTIDNAGDLRKFEIEHYEFSALRSAIELGLMTVHIQTIGHDSIPTADTNCSERTVSYVNFFTASCGIFLHCVLAYDSTSKVCDRNFDESYYAWHGVEVSPLNIRVSKWHKCGYNCCKKTYKICKSKSSTGSITGSETNHNIIRIMESEITSVSNCSLNHKFNKPCYTNCWNNP